jgi:hypothetical protein
MKSRLRQETPINYRIVIRVKCPHSAQPNETVLLCVETYLKLSRSIYHSARPYIAVIQVVKC